MTHFAMTVLPQNMALWQKPHFAIFQTTVLKYRHSLNYRKTWRENSCLSSSQMSPVTLPLSG